MKRLMTMLSLVCVGLMSLSCYNDEDIWNSVNSLDTRLKNVETLCSEMNTNITALQTFVSAMETGGYITDVTALTVNGVEAGYKLTFNTGEVAAIYHADFGKKALQVGVKEDADGVHYWTVEGEYILDKEGNKIAVNEAVTPTVKAENEKWHISFDGGATWMEIGDVVPGGSAYFNDVVLTEDTLTLTFADGSVIELPVGEPLQIVLGDYDADSFLYGTEVEIPYTVKGAKGDVAVFVVNDANDYFYVELEKKDDLTGKLVITQNDYWFEEYNGSVVLFAVDETGATVSKAINCNSGVLVPANTYFEGGITYLTSGEAGKVEIKMATNREMKVITSEDWIKYAETKAVAEKTVVLDVAKNDGARRKAVVKIISGGLNWNFYVVQQAAADNSLFKIHIPMYTNSSYVNPPAGDEPQPLDLSLLKNAEGKTLAEVLGYESWDALAVAIGDVATRRSFSGEVVVTGYDLYTGESFGHVSFTGLGQWEPMMGYAVDDEGKITTSIYGQGAYWFFNAAEDGYIQPILGSWPVGLDVVGEYVSYGIHFAGPEDKEARVEVTFEATEQAADPEAGKYDTPAAPGRYEFKIDTEVDIAKPFMNNPVQVLEVAESIKKTLGMTTNELSVADYFGQIEDFFVLADGKCESSEVWVDVNGWYTDNYDSYIVSISRSGCFLWVYLPYERFIENVYDPETGEYMGQMYEFGPAIKAAAKAGKVVNYEYVLKYGEYELVFTNSIKITTSAVEEEEQN